jgi:uncharacterized protein YndB with AHSA1/START domain
MKPPFLISAPGAEPVLIEGNFRATPQRVFRAWTNPQELKQWFGSTTEAIDVRLDCRVGGQWQVTFAGEDDSRDVLSGEYLRVDPDEHLVFSWMHKRTDKQGNVSTSAPSRVSVSFEPITDGTRVRLRHESIVLESGRLGVGQGWTASLSRLAATLNNNPHGGTPS